MQRKLIADFSKRDNNEDKMLREFFKNPQNRGFAREPVLAIMNNGTLVCTFLTGGVTEPWCDNVILIKRSYDKGETWSDAEILFSHSRYGLWCTEIFVDDEKATMIVSMYDGSCPFLLLQTFVSYSYDNGETWSKPTMLSPAFCTDSVRKTLVMSNGEILLPLYYTISTDCFEWNPKEMYKEEFWYGTHHECAVAISSDKGKTFEKYGRIWSEKYSLWENNCVELKDGHIVMYMRADVPQAGYLAMSESFDYGRTWTEQKLTDIENPGTKLTVFKFRKKLFLISNFDKKDRINLQMRISSDEGKSWEKIISLDDDSKMFCYPHVAIDEKNQVMYIAYENFEQHYLDIFSFDEIGL